MLNLVCHLRISEESQNVQQKLVLLIARLNSVANFRGKGQKQLFRV